MDGVAVALLIWAVFMIPFSLMSLVAYIIEVWEGYEELPKWMHRKKKNPRRVAARHGEVGRKVRHTKYEYIEIIPDFGGSVKGIRVRRVRR